MALPGTNIKLAGAVVVHLARFGVLYRLPVVLSTVNVSTGRNQPTIAPLQDVR
jgi:hypothetical protein